VQEDRLTLKLDFGEGDNEEWTGIIEGDR